MSLLSETGVRIAPQAFLAALAPASARWEAVFANQGFAPVREAWLAQAARLGEVIHARTGKTRLSGIFDGIDARGNLILRKVDGPVAIPAADVFF